MKIIDIEIIRNNNLINFICSNDDEMCKSGKYWGDDWNDTPFEHNCGLVYSRFADKILQIELGEEFEECYKTPDCDYDNSIWCRNDFKFNDVPIITFECEEQQVSVMMGRSELDEVLEQLKEIGIKYLITESVIREELLNEIEGEIYESIN